MLTTNTTELVRNIHKALILSHAYMFVTPGYQHAWILDNTRVFMSIRLRYKSSSEYYGICKYSSMSTSVAIDLAEQHYTEHHT